MVDRWSETGIKEQKGALGERILNGKPISYMWVTLQENSVRDCVGSSSRKTGAVSTGQVMAGELDSACRISSPSLLSVTQNVHQCHICGSRGMWWGSDSWELLLHLCGPQGRFRISLSSPTTKMIKPSCLWSYGVFLCHLLLPRQMLPFMALALATFLFCFSYRNWDIRLLRIGCMLISTSSIHFHLKFICVCIWVCELEDMAVLLGDHFYELMVKSFNAVISRHCLRDGLFGFSGY